MMAQSRFAAPFDNRPIPDLHCDIVVMAAVIRGEDFRAWFCPGSESASLKQVERVRNHP